MKAEVICVSDRNPTQPYYIYEKFLASLKRFGVEPTVLGWGQPWRGLMTKPRLFRQYLRDGQHKGDVLIICDAWDVVFAAHPDEIADKWLGLRSHPIVFNAERNCFPRGDLADQFPDTGTPWRYLNSGFMVGHPGSSLELLESMNLDAIPDDHQRKDKSWFNPNDQEHFMLAYLNSPVPVALDTYGELCVTCHGSKLEEFGFNGRQINNLVTDVTPCAFHFNGDAKNVIMPAVLKILEL